MGSVAGEIRLKEKAERVWEFITNPDNFSEYVYGYTEGKATTPNSVGPGAAYEWYGKIGPLKLKSKERIIDWQVGKRVGYRGSTLGATFDSCMVLTEAGSGETLFKVQIDYKVPALAGGGVTDALVVRRLVRSYVDRSLRSLAETFGEGRAG